MATSAFTIKTAIEIEEIKMLDLAINEPKTFKFKIHNTSGIDTDYYFFYELF